MTEPQGHTADFAGFAGLTVSVMMPETTDPVRNLFRTTEADLRAVGAQHASLVAMDVLRLHSEPGFHPAYDLASAVREFMPTVPDSMDQGHDNYARSYAQGFVNGMVHEGNRIRAEVAVAEDPDAGIPFHFADQQEFDEWSAQLASHRGMLLDDALQGIADQFDELAEAVADTTGVRLPGRHFIGFARQPVPAPDWEVALVDELAGAYGETEQFFRDIGKTHAARVAADVLRVQAEPGFQPAYDLASSVRDFQPEAPEDIGQELDDNDADYVQGFVIGLAEEAIRMRDVLDEEEHGQSLQPVDFDDEQEQHEWQTRFAAGRANLPPASLWAVTDQLEGLVRTITQACQVALPQEFRIMDEEAAQTERDRAALRELSAAIDNYAAEQDTLSRLPPRMAVQADDRARIAARIAVLDTRDPHLLQSLTADRAQVVHQILPESAERHRHSRPLQHPPLPPAEITNPDLVNYVTAAIDDLRARLNNPAGQGARLKQLFEIVGAAMGQDPAIVEHLPTVHAGLMRRIVDGTPARELADLADAATQAWITATHDRTLPTAAPTGARAPESPHSTGLDPLPGTPGSRHGLTHQPGAGGVRRGR